MQTSTTQHHSAQSIGPQRITMNYPSRLSHPLAAVVVALIAMTSPARPIAQTSLPVIMSALDNPSGLAFAAAPVSVAPAQTGIIAFTDYCTHGVYAIRGDGTGRVALPLPPLPEPASAFRYGTPRVLDVTTSGATTVVYQLAITQRDGTAPADTALYAVQVNDNGGSSLEPANPLRLALPADVPVSGEASVNPNRAWHGAFSSAGPEERLALVVWTGTANVLMTVKVDRDTSTSVTSLSDVIVVAELESLGVPDPGVASSGFTGTIDYAPDGSGIVASIYHDLWLVRLTSEHTLDAAEQLTPNTDGAVEWNPSSSPDGLRVAYTAGRLTGSGRVGNTNIYTVGVFSGTVTPITSPAGKGKSVSSPNDAMWTPDGTSIGFAAYTSSTARRATCSALVNSEIFLINSDGSGTASLITNTNGTSVEGAPKWGW